MLRRLLLAMIGSTSLAGCEITARAPVLAVQVSMPGSTPELIEATVTRPIEKTVTEVAGVKSISSTIDASGSVTKIAFETGTEPAAALSGVRQALSRLAPSLPAAAAPVVHEVTP